MDEKKYYNWIPFWCHLLDSKAKSCKKKFDMLKSQLFFFMSHYLSYLCTRKYDDDDYDDKIWYDCNMAHFVKSSSSHADLTNMFNICQSKLSWFFGVCKICVFYM